MAKTNLLDSVRPKKIANKIIWDEQKMLKQYKEETKAKDDWDNQPTSYMIDKLITAIQSSQNDIKGSIPNIADIEALIDRKIKEYMDKNFK